MLFLDTEFRVVSSDSWCSHILFRMRFSAIALIVGGWYHVEYHTNCRTSGKKRTSATLKILSYAFSSPPVSYILFSLPHHSLFVARDVSQRLHERRGSHWNRKRTQSTVPIQGEKADAGRVLYEFVTHEHGVGT